MNTRDGMNQDAGAFSRSAGRFAERGGQRLQHALGDLLLQFWDLVLKGLRDGARHDLINLLSLVLLLLCHLENRFSL
jgi:hypothetical protein